MKNVAKDTWLSFITHNSKGVKNDPASKTTPICVTPQQEELTLDCFEKIYTKQHPNWNKKYECFPGGPVFFDKLFNVQPFTRAKAQHTKMTLNKSGRSSQMTLETSISAT